MSPEEMQAMSPEQMADMQQGAMMGGAVAMLIWFVFIVLMIASLWKLFAKAGKPGWAAIVPIYNLVVLIEIVGRPLWQVLLFFVPFVNFVMIILLNVDLAKRFGKGTGFAVGLIFLPFVFMPLLAFGDAPYQAAAA